MEKKRDHKHLMSLFEFFQSEKYVRVLPAHSSPLGWNKVVSQIIEAIKKESKKEELRIT